MGIAERLIKQLAVLANEEVEWQNPHLVRTLVPIRVPNAARAYRDNSSEENTREVAIGLAQFEKYYKG